MKNSPPFPRPPLGWWLSQYRSSDGALMAFNVQNLTQLAGLVRASTQLTRPVIAQLSAKYASHEAKSGRLFQYIRLTGRSLVYLHLDHCTDHLLIHHCIRQGFDSVMFDGSEFPLEENIARTNQIAQLAHPAGCLVEAELGRIGGVEDDHGGESADCFSAAQFADFCARADADLVAPAIGNAHGFYADSSQVRLDLLPQAQQCLRATQSMVLHGGTGLPLADLQRAARAGVAKINISTHLKQRTRELMVGILAQNTLFDEAAVNAALVDGLVNFYTDYITALTTK